MIANNVAIQSISGPEVKTNVCAKQKLSQNTYVTVKQYALTFVHRK